VAEVTRRFRYERETKNTVRFQEVEDGDGEPEAVGTLYVQKWLLRQLGNPKELVVTLRAPARQEQQGE
jgi:hypothetical protein